MIQLNAGPKEKERMNTRSRGEKVGFPKPRTLSDSSCSSSSASSATSDSEQEEERIDEDVNPEEGAKETAASLGVLQLSDEDDDDGPIVPLNNNVDDDLDSIDSKLLFRSSPPPPAIPSTSKGLTSMSLAPMAAPSRVTRTSKPKPPTSSASQPQPGPSSAMAQSSGPTPSRVKKNIRKQYSDLIQKCQEFEEKEGFDESMETLMSGNIGRGQELLDEVGGGPGDMFLAFLHTRICSGMLKYKTVNIGSNTSAFKVDMFIDSLLEKCMTSDGEYIPRQAVKCISSSATDCCKTLSPMVALVGSFDRNSLSGQKEKEKKQRGAPRKRQFDETMAHSTQHEVVKYTSTERIGSQKATSQESFSKEILKVLRLHFQSSGQNPINMFEFTMDKTSFSNTIASLFFVAFLVRDGDVCLYRQNGQPNHEYTISIRPDKPPEKNLIQDVLNKKNKKKRRKDSERSQFIVSFSMKRWKELAAMSSGEDIISEHRRRMGEDDEAEDE